MVAAVVGVQAGSEASGSPVEAQLPPCTRCGVFAQLHTIGERTLCGACVQRTAHPILIEPLGLTETLHGFAMLVREIGLPALGLMLLLTVPEVALRLLTGGQLAWLEHVMQFFLPPLGALAFHVVAHRWVQRRERISFVHGLSLGMSSYWRFLGTALLIGLITALGLLMAILPGVFIAIAFAIVGPLCALEGMGGMTAALESDRRIAGNRALVFAALALVMTPILSVLIVLIFGSTFYLESQGIAADGPEWPARIVESASALITAACNVPQYALVYTLYAKITQHKRALSG